MYFNNPKNNIMKQKIVLLANTPSSEIIARNFKQATFNDDAEVCRVIPNVVYLLDIDAFVESFNDQSTDLDNKVIFIVNIIN